MYTTLISDALRDAKAELSLLEEQYAVTTQEVMEAQQGDPILAKIDGFDLIEWEFRFDQVKTLEKRNYHAHYTYARVHTQPQVRANEPEFELVA